MNGEVDWRGVDLVVFDVDGTLYDQTRLRLRMGMELSASVLSKRHSGDLRILRCFRRHRERLADAECESFMERQFVDVAQACGCPPDLVRSVVCEWMDRRPLRHLWACRYPGVDDLFETLRRSGRRIAVLSDYPAAKKLEALGLHADLTVSAGDAGVSRLKPHPAGLRHILRETGTPAHRALVVGDRFDRDWLAAARATVPALIRSRRPDPRCPTFRSFRSDVFAALGSDATSAASNAAGCSTIRPGAALAHAPEL